MYPNLLNRNFVPGELTRAWVFDITYLPTPAGPSFLATFMDLGSRRILGWAIDTTMSTQLVLRAFNLTVRIRNTYTSLWTVRLCTRIEARNIAQSCFKVGSTNSICVCR